MRRWLLTVMFGLIIASLIAPAAANHDNSPGKSQFGRCQALIHGNSEKKWDHGKPFQDSFGDVGDVDGDGDEGDLDDAIAYCTAYVEENHPGNGNGNGNGDNGDNGDNGGGEEGCTHRGIAPDAVHGVEEGVRGIDPGLAPLADFVHDPVNCQVLQAVWDALALP